jgi:hypothetical protein
MLRAERVTSLGELILVDLAAGEPLREDVLGGAGS